MPELRAPDVDAKPVETLLGPPLTDELNLVDALGAKGYHDEVPLWQFAAWAETTGLFGCLAGPASLSLGDIVARTALTEPGADALVGVLVATGLIERRGDRLLLAPLAREYLLPGSPFYRGEALYLTCREPLPAGFSKPGSGLDQGNGNVFSRLIARMLKRLRGWEYGGRRILENQHVRNLPMATAAAHLELFDEVECVVDIAGGTGTFSIPLAQRRPDARIVLAELPAALSGARRYLHRYGVSDRVELVGMDAFAPPWPVPECDVVFFGNFIHGWDDATCLALARNARARLSPGGCIVWHELLWNDQRDGPLKTALWNVTMRTVGGRQRQLVELHGLLETAGFERLFAVPTSGGYFAVGGYRARQG